MVSLPPFLLLLLLSSCFAWIASADPPSTSFNRTTFNRASFPPGFIFGAASAAYQVEGAAFEGGRKPSVWDTYVHKHPEKITDRSNGDVATDVYHRYREDVKIMKFIGLDTFRLSISWPRILPNGKLSGGINKEGVAFYNNFIDELLACGITPFVTLFHWDTPQALEDEYGGFLSPRIVDDFKDFVDTCFKEFGDRVKHWITLNEPYSYANGGYGGNFIGNFAPGRCSDRSICAEGNSGTEPYIVAHHLLLSHATVVKLYREKYKAAQKGEIGITLVSHWFVPYSNSSLDVQAAQRSIDFFFGWFMDPITYGDYPKVMRSIVQDRLPKFSTEQSKLLKGSYDFLGLNYYTGNYAAHVVSRVGNVSYTSDYFARLSSDRNGVPIGAATGVPALYSYPQGLHDLLVYIKGKYQDPYIYITENGIGDAKNGTVKQLITDPQRITFYTGHLGAVRQAIQEGVKMKCFIAWSFMDDYEWGSGYTQIFGLVFVDRDDNLKRIPKLSAYWYKNFLSKN